MYDDLSICYIFLRFDKSVLIASKIIYRATFRAMRGVFEKNGTDRSFVKTRITNSSTSCPPSMLLGIKSVVRKSRTL